MRFAYNLDLVAMSVIVAMMASYVALDLAGRVTHTEGRAARYWLVGGAVAMGAGIWSMHFIGMLAVKMPIQLGYDPLLTAASLLIAVVTSGFALAVVSRKTLNRVTILVGGVVMGAGICGMHYTGMAAMRMVPAIRYEPLLFGASVLVAVCAAMAALWLAFTLRSAVTSRSVMFKLLAAVVMGIAISGMHYTGMEAARFAPDSVCTAAVRLATDNSYLGQSIGVMMLLILSLTLLASLFDARLGARTTRMLQDLHESEEKYRSLLETTRDAVLLVDEAGTIRYANPTVESVFGYRPEELVGRALVMLQPERLRQSHLQGFQRYLGSGVRKLDWRAIEVSGLRRDGREIPLELAFSEVRLDGKRLFSGFLRDISERKEREARIARLSRMQAVLSGINSLIVRARSRQDLFDEACRVAVEQGQFRMAMIGLVAGDEFHPVSVYGLDDGYVRENIHLSLSGVDSEDPGPTASALRDRRESVCNDIAGDPTTAPWREAALRRGYRASASFPLLEGGELAGCISLYATEVGFFDAEELKLLSELAGDISHALGVIARDEQLDYLAYYDPLTRLANRKLFVQRLEQFLERARQDRSSLALVQLDVLRFAAVNDAVGRAGGDEALKLLADRIVGFAGSPSHVARIHGDCFAMVFPELRSPDLLQRQLEPLLAMLGRPVVVSDKELRIGASAGIALFPEDGDDANTLLRNAEAALKMAKSEHEGFLFYTREMGAVIGEKRSMEGKLRRAFERREFVLHYQPKVALNSGAICGAEALIRWNSPDLGLVPPERFVPLLEETGLILEVGHWALQQAAADYRDWQALGLRPPRLAVNLSPIQLRRPDFVERLRAALGESVADGSGVDLEITESVLMTDIERHIAKLNAVRQLGVSIAIDDFGTGYSSLAYLNKLPITAVKIDRSFVMQMTDSADTMNIVSTIISLAHSMSLRVIAEGVDSTEQLRFLRLLRCDEMQGFLFSQGLAKEEFEQLLREDRRLALS
ncbi:bifunctional diguanylate cyclase/phosphodiesterase [Nevskia soli]|uniref:bifunctional diguanylate cyclase/phosphodiesterase n=1 Tax=Nevskia soli TaxID=418856 RepID=UPI0012FA9893